MIVEADAAMPVRFVGAAGVGDGVGVGVGVAVGVAVGVGVGVGVGDPVLLTWIMLATEGTPLPFKMKSM